MHSYYETLKNDYDVKQWYIYIYKKDELIKAKEELDRVN